MTGMTISTKDISELRARTGAGIGDCKKALEEAGGDMAKAGELLRAKGIAKAEKRAGRSASQGLIGIEILGGGASGGMIELDCETDFVARTEEYHAVLNGMTSFVARSAPLGVTEVGADGAFLTTAYAGSTVDEVVKATSAKTGEAVQLRRIARFAPANGVVGHYLHHNEQVGTLVEIEGATGEAALALAKDLALHVASADPLAVAASDIDKELLERERRIAEEQVAAEKKPEQIRAKIVDGKIKKFVAERTLLEQPFVKNDKITVGELIKEASGKLGETISVRRFARFQVGAA